MHARPILLVRDPLAEGMVMHNEVKKALSDAGYFVLLAPPAAMDAIRVLAPCPFTQDDVDFLMSNDVAPHPAADAAEVGARLGSIAARIAGLLAQEARA